MRIPRKSGEAVIVLGGRLGAFTFGFWATFGALAGGGTVLLLGEIGGALLAWVGVWP